MRFALFCDDPAVIPWLDGLDGDVDHELTLAAVTTSAATDLLRGRSGIRLTQNWGDLLGSSAFDAILVGGNDPATLDAIKQMASAGQTLLFVPSTGQGSTFVYELSLIRDDNKVPIVPAVWHRTDPALIRAREIIRTEQVQLIQFERELVGGTSSIVSQDIVDAEMLLDVDLLRWLGGDYDQVTALRTGVSDAGVLNQTVKLAGRGLPESTWSVRAGKQAVSRVSIHSAAGTTVLELDPVSGEWSLIEPSGTRVEGNRRQAVREYLRRLASGAAVPIEWQELVKAFETTDATHRSIKRRRTIDLHFEPMSERAIFKTQMTAIGCSVLMVTLLLVLGYLAIASTVTLPPAVLILMRTLVFAPLGLFLLLQFLYPLTRPSEGAPSGDTSQD